MRGDRRRVQHLLVARAVFEISTPVNAQEEMLDVYRVNAIGPLLVVQAVCPLLVSADRRQPVIAFLSSQVCACRATAAQAQIAGQFRPTPARPRLPLLRDVFARDARACVHARARACARVRLFACLRSLCVCVCWLLYLCVSVCAQCIG